MENESYGFYKVKISKESQSKKQVKTDCVRNSHRSFCFLKPIYRQPLADDLVLNEKLLASYIKQRFQRSIPPGCVALVFHKGNKIISSFHKGTQPQSYMNGQISTYSDIEFSFLDIDIILFQPIGCKIFFPYSMEELTN